MLVGGVEYAHKGLLRDLHRANAFHSLFAFLLLFEQFHFPGHIAAVKLGGDSLALPFDGFSRDDLAADRYLQRYFKLMPWDGSAEANNQPFAACQSSFTMDNK